jgi:hypothetical protein
VLADQDLVALVETEAVDHVVVSVAVKEATDNTISK